MKALQNRRSTRSFSDQELPLDVLSNLLWAAGGINRAESGMRTAPSAKNQQEIDIYVAMKSGVYLYNAKTNTLDPVIPEDIRAAAGIQDFTQEAPVDLIFVADFNKMSGDAQTKKFYAGADTGFISQNVYLFCASEGLATVVLGWFDQTALAKAMGLKAGQEIILTQPVGYPK
jgi:SagB-type dehydrogenase family enzyme